MTTSTAIPKPGFSPINFQDRPLGWKLAAIVVGSLFLTLSSYIEVPMVPVPVTMQTFAVALVGALYGWRLGGVTIVAWLVQGALGLPVLAGGAAGALHLWARRRLSLRLSRCGYGRGLAGRARLERTSSVAGLRRHVDRQRAVSHPGRGVARGAHRRQAGHHGRHRAVPDRRCPEGRAGSMTLKLMTRGVRHTA